MNPISSSFYSCLLRSLLLAIACAEMMSVTTCATVLIFEPATGGFTDFGVLPPGYGNRVTAEIQDGFKYSLDGGPTPNIVVEYNTNDFAPLFTWGNDYGDLTHVVFALEPKLFQMRLVADPGYQVILNSFDMAAWPHLDYTINSVQVIDDNGSVLFQQGNAVIEGDGNGPPHTHYQFHGVSGQTVLIQFDSLNVDSDDVGIDNINFSQSSFCPRLDIIQINGRVFISWPGVNANLEEADEVTGQWRPVFGAVSPYSPAMLSARKFYRLLCL